MATPKILECSICDHESDTDICTEGNECVACSDKADELGDDEMDIGVMELIDE